MPTRFFALEFIRRSLNVDQVHVVPTKIGYFFKLPMTIGDFIVNNRKVAKEVDKMLHEMQFQQGEKWSYDLYHIISRRRV